MFTGSFTALVTPFRDGSFDEQAFRSLVDFQIENGITGIVPVGTTGEAATLDASEHLRVIEVALEQSAGRCQVVAGTGSNSTKEAIELSLAAQRLGVDGVLLASPYYNKPTQEGIYRHYRAISESLSTKIMLYNIPGRTGGEIALDTCVRLARDCKNIVSIKEAGGSCDRVSSLRLGLPPKFTILSGDDSLTLPFLALGAEGTVSVASNVIPREITNLTAAFRKGRADQAQEIHLRYFPLFKSLFLESNPIPVKAALHLMGRIQAEYRLPLCEMSSSNLASLRSTLTDLGLI